MIYRSLHARAAAKDLFASGNYLRVEPEGEFAKHIVAFARRNGSRWSLTVVPRLLARMVDSSTVRIGEKVWRDTRLPIAGGPEQWTNALIGNPVKATAGLRVADALADLPVALLTSPGES